MTVFMFPGQGSQRRGMAQELFDSVIEYRRIEGEVDRFLGYSMRELCVRDPQGQLKDTRYTQPALFTANALYFYRALAEGRRPELVLGHSLGEYNALLAANVFDFMTGLRLVCKRGELMSQAKDGAMAAIIGLPGERVARLLSDNDLHTVDVANFNSPTQVVLSGPATTLDRAIKVMESAGATMCVRLQVSAAFHSRYMAAAAQEFAGAIASVEFRSPALPVISNVSGREHARNPDEIKAALVRQITHPVLWTQSIEQLRARGFVDFHEVGPGNVLTRLVEQIAVVRAA
jgi:malonyl CoA-acyl carrier protein transacylase